MAINRELRSFVRAVTVQAAKVCDVQFAACYVQRNGVKLYSVRGDPIKLDIMTALIFEALKHIGFKVELGQSAPSHYYADRRSVWVRASR